MNPLQSNYILNELSFDSSRLNLVGEQRLKLLSVLNLVVTLAVINQREFSVKYSYKSESIYVEVDAQESGLFRNRSESPETIKFRISNHHQTRHDNSHIFLTPRDTMETLRQKITKHFSP